MRNGGYYYGEKWYQILSLSAKTILVWQLIGGVNQPDSQDDVAALTSEAPVLLEESEPLL